MCVHTRVGRMLRRALGARVARLLRRDRIVVWGSRVVLRRRAGIDWLIRFEVPAVCSYERRIRLYGTSADAPPEHDPYDERSHPGSPFERRSSRARTSPAHAATCWTNHL